MVPAEGVAAAIRPDTILITIMHANNEVGTIQPIAEISKIVKEKGICVHTDAAQSVGKIETDVQVLNVDLLSVAGHKLYAPKGIGALYARKGIHLEKICHGAGQERRWRAGTENVLGIVGLGKACKMADRSLGYAGRHLREMRDRFHMGLTDQLGDIRLNGHPEHRLPNTLNLLFKGLEANRILEEIGLAVAASAGAACHSDTVELSHVLEAMQVPVDWAKGTVRFSTGRFTTSGEIDRAVAIVFDVVKRLKK